MYGARLRKTLRRFTGGALPGPRVAVLALVVVYAVVFSVLSIQRHEMYSSARFDLGNMDQAVWNSSQGRILEATDEDGQLTSRLKNHADFLLLAFVPLYWIAASPYWLLIVQSMVVGLGALPLFWLAKRFMVALPGREWLAALVALAYLFNYGLESANIFDFHSQTMAGTLLLFAFHYLLERRPWPFVAFAAVAAATKEGTVLAVAMMGLYVLLFERRHSWRHRLRWGVPIFAAGMAYFFFVVKVLIPGFNPDGSSELVEERFGEIGGSVSEVLVTAVTDPLFVASYALSGNFDYLGTLIGLGGIIAVFAPHLLLIALPELAINLLSNRPQMTSIYYQYSAPIIPFIYLASAVALNNMALFLTRLRDRSSRGSGFLRRFSDHALLGVLPATVMLWVLAFNVYMHANNAPVPYARFYVENPVVMEPLSEEYRGNIDEALATIPDDARVSASNWIAPHLAHRRYLYTFPTIRDAEYVVVDMRRPSYYTTVNREKALQTVRSLLDNPRYELSYTSRNVVVFELQD